MPPPSLGYDGFYHKYLDGNGIPVLASSAVDDRAVIAACKIVVHMVKERDDVRRALIDQHQSVAIIGVNEVTTDIPEYSNLYQLFPNQDWDRLRGVGATLMIPVSSVGEENLLCLANDFFAGEKLLVQTFATAVLLGLDDADSTFDSRLRAAYDAATSAGLWRNTYAGANVIEYYARGRAELVRREPRRLPAGRDERPDQHARRARGLRSRAGVPDRRDDGRRLEADLSLERPLESGERKKLQRGHTADIHPLGRVHVQAHQRPGSGRSVVSRHRRRRLRERRRGTRQRQINRVRSTRKRRAR